MVFILNLRKKKKLQKPEREWFITSKRFYFNKAKPQKMEVKIITWNNKVKNTYFASGIKWTGRNPFYCLLYTVSSKWIQSCQAFQLLKQSFMTFAKRYFSSEKNFYPVFEQIHFRGSCKKRLGAPRSTLVLFELDWSKNAKKGTFVERGYRYPQVSWYSQK